MTEKVAFTKVKIDSFPVPEKSKRAYYYDTKTPGLTLQVTAAGTKTFQVYKWANNKAVRITLGKYPGMTIEQARKQTLQKLAELADGINPNQKKKAEKVKGITLIECFEHYLEIKVNLQPGTIKDYTRVMNEGFSDWQDKPLKDISRDMVAAKHRKLGVTSQARANNAMRVLRAIFNFAAEMYEDEEGKTLFADNPVKRLSKTSAWFQINRKQTIVHNYDLEAWVKAIQYLAEDGSEKNIAARDYLFTLLLTGMRRTECATLPWGRIDFKLGALKLEAIDTKNQKSIYLPLSDYVLKILEERYKNRTQDDFIFLCNPNISTYILDARSIVKKVTKISNVKFTLHDLRRTFATAGERQDISVYSLKKLINHSTKSIDVTDGYIITDVERLRPIVQSISDYILGSAKII